VIQVDSSLLLQIINFVALIFILNFLLYKPLLAMMDKRKHIIDGGKEEIDRLHRTVTEKMAAYEAKLLATKVEALGKNKELIKEGSEQAQALIADANREIQASMEEFHQKLQTEVRAARELLNNQSQVLSVEIAEKVLGRRLQ